MFRFFAKMAQTNDPEVGDPNGTFAGDRGTGHTFGSLYELYTAGKE